MEWTNNISVSQLFLSHDVVLMNQDQQYIIHIPSLKEISQNVFYSQFLQLFRPDFLATWRKTLGRDFDKGQLLEMLMTDPYITNLVEFSPTSHLLHDNLSKLLPQFKIVDRKLFSGTAPLNDEALSEILYILQLGIGKKVEKPQHFGPDEQAAKQFYERSLAAKAKAAQIKAKAHTDEQDGLMQMFVMINYKFPIYTFEQLYDMTLLQLHYLQKTASAMISYEHGMSAYTTGNLKKPPQFFFK